MKNLKLANRYAKSLFQFALDKDRLEIVNQDLALIKSVLKENRELKAVIESPILYPEKKISIFTQLFGSKIDEVSNGFLSLLIKKKREPSLINICNEFVGFYNDYHHIKIADITTSKELSTDLLSSIQKLMEEETGYKILLQQHINPDIIGGIIVKMDDFVFDASIISKINKLKLEFAHNIYQANF